MGHQPFVENFLDSAGRQHTRLVSEVFKAEDATQGLGWVDVKNYGAIGDGFTDDTVAIQAAITAALALGGGRVYFPQPSVYYKVTSTLNISGVFAYLHFASDMAWYGTTIQWGGGNNSAVFKSLGWKGSHIEGINISLGSATGMTAWDINEDASHISTSNLTFRNCHVNLKNGTSNIGWRHGNQGTASGYDNSLHTWINCTVEGDTALGTSGQIGWTWRHLNCLGYTWINCYGSSLAAAWSGLNSSGLGAGGGDMQWIGCNGSNNTVDFQWNNSTPLTVIGGRFENGKKLIDVPFGDTPCPVVNLIGVVVDEYSPSDSRVVYMKSAAHITFQGCRFNKASGSYGADMITLGSVLSNYGSLAVINSTGTWTDPFYTLAGTNWIRRLDGNAIVDPNSTGSGNVQNLLTHGVIATASLPAAAAAQDGRIVIEDNGAGDRNLVVYAGGQRFRIDGGVAF